MADGRRSARRVAAFASALAAAAFSMSGRVVIARSAAADGGAITHSDTSVESDTTPPSVSITAPGAGANVTGSVTVSASASDDVGVAGVQFFVDGVNIGREIASTPYAVGWPTQGASDLIFGVVKVIVGGMTIGAASGLTKRQGVSCPGCGGDDTATVDTIQSTAGAAAANFTFSGAAHYLAHMAAFKASGTTGYLQGAATSSNSASTTIANAFGASTSAGTLIVAAVAWTGTAPLSVSDTKGNSFAIATSAFDSGLGQSLAIAYASNATAGADTVTASFGGQSPTVRRLEIHEYSGISATNPLDATSTHVGEGTTTPNTVTSGATYTSAIAPMNNGSHTLTAQARDAAGNRSTSAPITVTVNADTTPPAMSSVAASSITTSGARITWTTNETSDSQVDYGSTTSYGGTSALYSTLVTSHSVTLGGLNGGTVYHVRARSRDAAGNLALSNDVTFTTLDGTPPTVSITAPANGAAVSGTVTVSATATDNVGVAGVQFAADGVNLGAEVTAPPYTVPWRTNASSDLIFGVVKVAVGPMTIGAGSGFTKREGISCPTCSGDDTATADRVQSSPGSAAATFTFSGPAHYLAHVAAFKAATTPVYLQSESTSSNSASTTIATTFSSSITAGSLLVAAVAWQGTAPLTVTDSRGNSYAVAATGYDAGLGQSLAIVYAANAASGATTVTAGFGSQSPTVRRLEIHEYRGMAASSPLDGTASHVDDGTSNPDDVTTGAAATTVTPAVSDGSHTLTAFARDAAGNATTSAAVTVAVRNDATAPTVSITTPADGSTVSGTVTVAANASDDVGVAGVQFLVDGAVGADDTAAPYSVAWNTTTQPSGAHSLTAVARDAAGNRTTSAAIRVTVDNSTGQVTLAWDPSTDPRAVGYKIYIGTASGVYSVRQVDVGNVTTYVLSGLPGGTVYYFAATAYDVNHVEGGYSNEVSKSIP